MTEQGLVAAGVDFDQLSDVTRFDIDENDLSINIEVELPYIGNASADGEGLLWGVTYVLDFEDFDAHSDAINQPGTCQNRQDDSYNGASFVNDFWDYSLDPTDDIGNDAYLAYPDPTPESGSWSVAMDSADECGTLIYSGKFTWSELRGCKAFGGDVTSGGIDSYTNIITDDEWLNLTGTFYINLVSPYWYNSDTGFYRVYQLLSQPFVIAISSVVNVLGSTGINVMTMSVIAVYKEDEGPDNNGNDMYGDFKLILLTECSDYMVLDVDTTIGVTFDGSVFSNTQVTSASFDISKETENDGCLNNKGFICSQLWQINATDIACTDSSGRDFSGNYALTFTPQCRAAADIGQPLVDHCNTFLNNHQQLTTGSRVALNTDLVWKDEICDPIIFTVQFDAEMTFYDNNTFSSPVGNDKLFQVGEDTIYVQVNVSFPSNTMDVFETELVQVHICTFDPLVDVETNYNDPDDLTNFGCFVSNANGRDTKYDKYFYQIYQSDPNDPLNPTVSLYDFADPTQYTENMENAVRFSFTVPRTVARDKLYVMAEIEVTLQESRRRRVLLGRPRGSRGRQSATANQMEHFIQPIGINYGQEIIKQPPNEDIPRYNEPNNYNPPQQYYPPQQPAIPQQPYPVNPVSSPSSYTINLSSPWVIALGGLLGIVLTFNIVFMTYRNCCDNNNRSRGRASFMPRRNKKGKYSKVNNADSEFDSEAQMIQNDDDESQ